jgi:hypothetical protein
MKKNVNMIDGIDDEDYDYNCINYLLPAIQPSQTLRQQLSIIAQKSMGAATSVLTI